MKKALAFTIIAVLAIASGFFAYRYANPVIQKPSAAARTDSSVDTGASETAGAPPAQGNAAGSFDGPVLTESSAKKDQTTDEEHITSAINLDWSRYKLKASAPKILKDKTYSAYDIWDEDYVVGPRILVDRSSKGIFTWAPSDSAPIPVEKDKAFDKTVHTITGIMKDGAMMSIVLTTDSGNQLTVRRLGVDTSRLTSLKSGDRIRVTYTGVITGNDTTRAFITKLENVP